MSDKKPSKVHIVPVPGRYIPGVADVAQDVDPDVAAELLAYTPAAFVVEDDPEPETEKE